MNMKHMLMPVLIMDGCIKLIPGNARDVCIPLYRQILCQTHHVICG